MDVAGLSQGGKSVICCVVHVCVSMCFSAGGWADERVYVKRGMKTAVMLSQDHMLAVRDAVKKLTSKPCNTHTPHMNTQREFGHLKLCWDF